ncbi:MAG: hypothetical protein BMS9Abin02_2041 [Anaerolineae bacterium]|nr:MAG: hypothetical protein BMS9Abin02_2041 [Anaerolineae bacterium]
MATINYNEARNLLSENFSIAETQLVAGITLQIDEVLFTHFNVIFSSNTQSYREVLLGCNVTRILDKDVDIHLPYVSHGERAFNARDLDEKVINPFLQVKRIPSTKGPYLSTFRRQARFDNSTRERLRDKTGYDSLLFLIDYVARTDSDEELLEFFHYLLFRFAQLREASIVPLTRIQRFSLEQYNQLFDALLSKPSGGLFPVILVECMFHTLREFFRLEWEIESQGINVADASSGAGGDITIFESNGHILLSIEVTERQVDKSRVVSTFNTKIAPTGIEDYLFLVGSTEPSEESKAQARRYFAQGHEINFAHLCDWIVMLLATLGKEGRAIFNSNLMDLLDDPGVPQAIKVTWNESVASLFGD